MARLAVMTLTAVTGASFAQDPLDAPPSAACRPDGTPAQVEACAWQGWQRADEGYQRALQGWLSQQPAGARPAARQREQSWRAERDTQCRELAADASLPQAAAGEYHACRKARTLERTAQLQSMRPASSLR